ncbi:hypothetical protein BJX64DRAFT_289158 [Aspergillus heterothallicus]
MSGRDNLTEYGSGDYQGKRKLGETSEWKNGPVAEAIEVLQCAFEGEAGPSHKEITDPTLDLYYASLDRNRWHTVPPATSSHNAASDSKPPRRSPSSTEVEDDTFGSNQAEAQSSGQTSFTRESKRDPASARVDRTQPVAEDRGTPKAKNAELIDKNLGKEHKTRNEPDYAEREEEVKQKEDEIQRMEKRFQKTHIEAQRISGENDKLREELRRLTEENRAYIGQVPAVVHATESEERRAIRREERRIEELQEDERQHRVELSDLKHVVTHLNERLDRAGNVMSDYRGKMVDYEQKSDQWIQTLRHYTGMLTAENASLNQQLAEIRNFITSVRESDTRRWVVAVQEDEEARQRRSRREDLLQQTLTYGTIDREMADAFEIDARMGETPEPYVPPASTRVRRRLANIQGRKRVGSPEPQVARPLECRSVTSRAVEAYLTIRKPKEGKEIRVPKVGEQFGIRTQPRKRTRLAKGADMIRRLKAVEDAQKLPTPPQRIGPWYSAKPYDRRNDEELAKMMSKLTISRHRHEDRGIQVEHDFEAKIVTIEKPVANYIPRGKVYNNPVYLPQEPTPLSKADRAKWARITDNWTLGPKRAPKKQVRFAKDLVHEPQRRALPAAPVKKERRAFKTPQFRINWAHVLIMILMFLLWWSNLGSPEDPERAWKMANKAPEKFAAQLRNSHSGIDSRTVRILEFEAARFSDIDPGIIG